MNGFRKGFTIGPGVTLFVPLVKKANKGINVRSSTVIMRNLTGGDLGRKGVLPRVLGRSIISLVGTDVVDLIMFVCGFFVLNSENVATSISLDLFTIIVFTDIFKALIPVALSGLGVSPTLTAKPFVAVAGSVVNVVVCVFVASTLTKWTGGRSLPLSRGELFFRAERRRPINYLVFKLTIASY